MSATNSIAATHGAAWKLCTLGGRGVLKIKHVVVCGFDRVDDI